MSKKIMLVVVSVVLLGGMYGLAGIGGSKHDFSSAAWNNGGNGEICQPCHTPHNATASTAGPLWNHTNTATAASTFGFYTNVTMQATDIGDPSGVSMACLGCHDGTVALDAFGGSAGNAANTMKLLHPSKDVGTDVSNDHPISFTYDSTLATADGGLFDPTNATISKLLFAGKVECGSCHDVHGSPVGATNLLTVVNTTSELCLTCHDK